MSRDNEAPSDEGHVPQARRLAEEALAASSVGDTQTSDQLFAEAERRDPQAVADVLQEDGSASRPPAPPPPPHGGRPQPPASFRLPTTATNGANVAPRHARHADIALEVNGQTHRLTVDCRATLLDALRDYLGLSGTKKGCNLGQCGSCTVLVDGRRINACLTLAVMAQGHPITTIEGLPEDGTLHPMQAAFITHDAFQCGYCTPGQIMSAVGMLIEGRGKDDAEIADQMSGNICRCGAYVNIVDAVRSVRDGQVT